MQRNCKRGVILGIIIYVMLNAFVWGIMKAYVGSHNSASREQLAMAQITDSEKGRNISIMGNSFEIPEDDKKENNALNALKTLVPVKIRAAEEIFENAVRKIFEISG